MSVLTTVKCSRSLNELSEKLPEVLFTNSWAPSKEELSIMFQQVSSYHQDGKLNTDNVTLYQQQLIASLMTLDVASKNIIGDIHEISDIWPSCFAIFKARLDSLTVEIIIRDASNIFELATTYSKFKIIKDIDSLAQSAINRAENNSSAKSTFQSVRLSNIKTLLADYTVKSSTWLEGALKVQSKSQIDLVSIFYNFMRGSTNSQSQLARDSHSFLMTYLKSGHVSNIWIYTKQTFLDQLTSHQKVHCKQLPQNHSEQMLLLVQIGRHIWVQTDRLDSFGVYKLPEHYSFLQVLVSRIVEKNCNSHYLFSRKGFWQYKLAFFFKNGTDFIPKRSDYLTL